jgi:hypothetical protein
MGGIEMKDELDFEVVREPWSEYRLEDGTIYEIKIVLTNIRLKEGKDPDGNPHYEFIAQPVGRIRNRKPKGGVTA